MLPVKSTSPYYNYMRLVTCLTYFHIAMGFLAPVFFVIVCSTMLTNEFRGVNESLLLMKVSPKLVMEYNMLSTL